MPNAVMILYTNHRGETSGRRIVPLRIWFGNTAWHKDDQWLMDAFDVDRDAERSFAMKNIVAWEG